MSETSINVHEDFEILGLDDIAIQNTNPDDIDSEVVNLILVAVDASGSMTPYISDMQKALIQFQEDLTNSKEADEILVARATFASRINVGGYKGLKDFDTSYNASGGTKLYDVIVECGEKLLEYMDYLKGEGFRVKAVFSVFSDGEDTASVKRRVDAGNIIVRLNQQEVTTAFISFGPTAVREANALGFCNILTVGASSSELRRAFAVLSKSVIDQSRSVTPLTNNFFSV